MLLILRFIIIFLYIYTIHISVVKCYNVKNINTYRKLTIEDDRVCSALTKRKIELKKNDYQSVFITQTTTKNHIVKWSSSWVCKFQVVASSYGGLFAVIQNINFRKESNGDCIDYVQFHNSIGKSSRKICGISPIAELIEDNLTKFEGMFSYEGKIDTEIYIHRDELDIGEDMDLEIVYTAFTRCNASTSKFSCIEDDKMFCINETFFNDSIVNCPFEWDCRDEGSCQSFMNDYHNAVNTDDSSMVTKVVLSAVTSLFVSFICVIVVIWLCRKMGTACCLSLHGEQSESVSRPQSRVIEMQTRGEPEDTITTVSPPSAPDYDKDLPPSYESLFPQPQR